jgi:hypothetical protein
MSQKAKKVENTDFKLWYTGKERSRNDIGILIDKSFKIELSQLGDKRT